MSPLPAKHSTPATAHGGPAELLVAMAITHSANPTSIILSNEGIYASKKNYKAMLRKK
jgi:hypothetical protein